MLMATLLSRLNDDINTRTVDDPVRVALCQVKSLAYRLQTQQQMSREDALLKALEDTAVSIEDENRSGYEHLRFAYVPKVMMMTDDQIRNILPTLKHLPNKQKIRHIITKYRGKVTPQQVIRVVQGN